MNVLQPSLQARSQIPVGYFISADLRCCCITMVFTVGAPKMRR
jgi:hypothetical protein